MWPLTHIKGASHSCFVKNEFLKISDSKVLYNSLQMYLKRGPSTDGLKFLSFFFSENVWQRGRGEECLTFFWSTFFSNFGIALRYFLGIRYF